jgi:archaellum component FlaF (FlaF/FlaG flagellin family)
MLRSVSFLPACLALILLASCSNHVKKVVVMANGKVTMDDSKQKLKLDPSNTHNEEELVFNSGDKVTLSVESPDGTKTFDVTDDGVYVLNLKVDTLTGGMVNYSSSGRAASMSREQLDHMVDSTQQLLEGRNVSDDKKNYFIVPGNIKKITANTNARIIGPYKGIPYKIEEDASGKPTEVYKFFTNKQQRESLGDLLKRMTNKE